VDSQEKVMKNNMYWTRSMEKKSEQTRSIVIGFCIGIIFLVGMAMWLFQPHEDTLLDAVGVVVPDIPAQMSEGGSSLKPGIDFPEEANDGAVLVVEKGASFRMMPSSTNQPVPVSEADVLARQQAAREAQQKRQ